MKRIVLVLVLAGLLYLMFWPVPIQPVAWTPPASPDLRSAPYAQDDALRAVQRIADGAVAGPEAIAFGPDGRLYTGLADGRVVSMDADGANCRVFANTAGRPLGLSVQADGSVWIADARRGLVRLESNGRLDVKLSQVDGLRLGFADDLAVDARGRVILSDASWKFGYGEHLLDALEHGGRGRLVYYDPEQDAAAALLANLQFANGVTLGPDEAYALVNESAAYRITRFWLKGERAGQSEVFSDALPGFPDNVTFNGRDRFWVALFGPRDPMLDALAGWPFLRKVVARVVRFWHPVEARQGFVLGIDLEGKVVEQYRHVGAQAFGPITSVREHAGMLYLGSLSDTAIGRVSLDALRRGDTQAAPAPIPATACVPPAT